jgi:glutathione peroxidase
MAKAFSARQKGLSIVYPFFMWVTKAFGLNAAMQQNHKMVRPHKPFYDLAVPLNDGSILNTETLKGKKILIVNTASDCGYTAQYNQLQQLQQRFKESLVVIGFPANDFKEQEKGSDEDIAAFCQKNFGVTFPLAKKSSVKKGPDQNNIFYWLSHKEQNGWYSHQPKWNFSKYLINEQGVLTHYFDPSISPLSDEVISAIESK